MSDPTALTASAAAEAIRRGDVTSEALVAACLARIAAIDAQAAALDNFLIDGIADNIPFLGAVMEEKDFRKGDFTTAYIKQHFPDGFQGVPPTSEQEKLLIAVAALGIAVMVFRMYTIWFTAAPPAAQSSTIAAVSSGLRFEMPFRVTP